SLQGIEQPPSKHRRASREAGKVSRAGLLHVHLRASLFELGLGGVGLVLRDALLDRLRSGIYQLLGFLQAQARDQLAYRLDDVDLVRASLLEDDTELGLFLGG